MNRGGRCHGPLLRLWLSNGFGWSQCVNGDCGDRFGQPDGNAHGFQYGPLAGV